MATSWLRKRGLAAWLRYRPWPDPHLRKVRGLEEHGGREPLSGGDGRARKRSDPIVAGVRARAIRAFTVALPTRFRRASNGVRNMHQDDLRYCRIDGPSEIYEVHLGDRDIGIVWLRNGRWYGDPVSMLAPEIEESSREEAAVTLLERRHAITPSTDIPDL